MDNYKICSICNVSRINSDYVNNNDECYKCVYARKVKSIKATCKSKKCRLCDNFVQSSRWTYCSRECATKAKEKNKHWSLGIKIDTKGYKRRFMF